MFVSRGFFRHHAATSAARSRPRIIPPQPVRTETPTPTPTPKPSPSAMPAASGFPEGTDYWGTTGHLTAMQEYHRATAANAEKGAYAGGGTAAYYRAKGWGRPLYRYGGFGGLGAVDMTIDPTAPKPWYADILQQGLSILQAKQVQDVNKQRLAAGLPPLTDAQARALAPTANVKVAVPAEVKPLIWIAGGSIVLLTLSALQRRRRR